MSDDVRTIRCSVLDGLFACTPSVLDESGLVRISTAGEAAELGKVVHALAASYIETGSFDLKGECSRRGFEDAEEFVLRLVRLAQLFLDLLRLRVQPRVVEGDAGPRRDAGRQALMALTKDADPLVAEEQAADCLACAGGDRDGEVAVHRKMPFWLALIRRVLAVVRVFLDVVGAQRSASGCGRCEPTRLRSTSTGARPNRSPLSWWSSPGL